MNISEEKKALIEIIKTFSFRRKLERSGLVCNENNCDTGFEPFNHFHLENKTINFGWEDASHAMSFFEVDDNKNINKLIESELVKKILDHISSIKYFYHLETEKFKTYWSKK